MKAMMIAATLLALSTSASAQTLRPDARDALQALSGIYASPEPEDWGGAFGRRTFVFADGRWSLRFELALDPAMSQRVFDFATEGTYHVGPASTAVPGAFEALFREETKRVTLHATDPGLIQGFGLGECGLTPGRETDVSVSGCAGWKPVAVCGEDHDLLALDTAGGLYFGVRPRDNDLCTADKRPTALLSPVVRR